LALSDVALISVATTGVPVSRPGFGTPLIADPCLAWGASNDRVRTYKTAAALLADGFTVNDAAYKAASAIFAQQSPSAPVKLKVGRRANKPTQHWTITPTAQDSTKYRVTIDGVDFDFTSGVGTTVALIVAGLKAVIDAALPAGVTTTNIGPNTALGINSTVAGAWHQVKCMRPDVPAAPHPQLAVLQDQADPGITADLAAILAADSDWYGLVLTHTSKAEILAAAAWVETNEKLFVQATQDSDARTTAPGGADVMATAKLNNYFRTAVCYHPDNGAFLGAAEQGARLPTDPGSENWMFTNLAGVAAVYLTATEQANIEGKNGNYYYEVVSGSAIFAKGKVAGNEWIDKIRYRDWLKVNMGLDLLQMQIRKAAAGSKVAYDDAGIAANQNAILSRLLAGERAGGAIAGSSFCTVPKAADVPDADRASRTLNGVQFGQKLTGAINLTSVAGVLT
jgi:hypothetical protein